MFPGIGLQFKPQFSGSWLSSPSPCGQRSSMAGSAGEDLLRPCSYRADTGTGSTGPLRRAGRDMELFRKNWVLWALYAVLGLNILEASLKDLALGNYFNGISGFILIVTIPLFKSKGMRDGWAFSRGKPHDMLAYTDPIWNFLYTTWNIAFRLCREPGLCRQLALHPAGSRDLPAHQTPSRAVRSGAGLHAGGAYPHPCHL